MRRWGIGSWGSAAALPLAPESAGLGACSASQVRRLLPLDCHLAHLLRH